MKRVLPGSCFTHFPPGHDQLWRVTPSPQLRMPSGQWFSLPCSPQGAQLFYSCIWGRDRSGKEPVEAFLHWAHCGGNTGLCSYRARERDEPQHWSSRKALCEILAQQRKKRSGAPRNKAELRSRAPGNTALCRLVPASPVRFHYLYRALDEQSNVHWVKRTVQIRAGSKNVQSNGTKGGRKSIPNIGWCLAFWVEKWLEIGLVLRTIFRKKRSLWTLPGQLFQHTNGLKQREEHKASNCEKGGRKGEEDDEQCGAWRTEEAQGAGKIARERALGWNGSRTRTWWTKQHGIFKQRMCPSEVNSGTVGRHFAFHFELEIPNSESGV